MLVNRSRRYGLALLLAVALLAAGLSQAFAANAATNEKKVYSVAYTDEELTTPMDWYNSTYFNNPTYKETRFSKYWTSEAQQPTDPEQTGFYVIYREDGVYFFFQFDETGRNTEGVLDNNSVELYLQPGGGDTPYHQAIIQTNGDGVEYYEWQIEYRDNRPLKDKIVIHTSEIPTGWGTVMIVPWDAVYEDVPIDGGDWLFNVIRFAPFYLDSMTWDGVVHQPGKFNILRFQEPTAAQRTAIQKQLIAKAWAQFGSAADAIGDAWNNGDASDASFHDQHIQPIVAAGQAAGSLVPDLDSLTAAQIDELYGHLPQWLGFRYDVDDARTRYVKDWLFADNAPPTVGNYSHTVAKNGTATGTVAGTDPDGDPLTYALGDAPAHGTAVVQPNGDWTYTPEADYIGSDAFTVVVSDDSNATAVSTISLDVLAGPDTSLVLAPASGWYTQDVLATLNAPGAASTEYRLNGGDWQAYEQPFVVSDEGVNVLEYRSKDSGGTYGDVRSGEIRIDKTAPSLQVQLQRSPTGPDRMAAVQATLSKSDAASGVASVKLISITGSSGTAADIQGADYGTEDTTFQLKANNNNGNHRVYKIVYEVTDHAGWKTQVESSVTIPKHSNGNDGN